MNIVCSNQTERRFYPIFDPLSVSSATSGDSLIYGTVNLITTQTIGANPSGAGSTTISYPDAFDSKTFSVDASGNLVIKQTGLYSVEMTAVINSNLFPTGTRGQYCIVDGIQADKHGYVNTVTNLDVGTNASSLFSSFTIKLFAGQTLTHEIRGNQNADVFVIGTDGGFEYNTNMKVLLLMLSPV